VLAIIKGEVFHEERKETKRRGNLQQGAIDSAFIEALRGLKQDTTQVLGNKRRKGLCCMEASSVVGAWIISFSWP
jgi:hypothetical protein